MSFVKYYQWSLWIDEGERFFNCEEVASMPFLSL